MSEPQQPPVPSSADPNPPFPPAPPVQHLPAAPQYPAGQQPAPQQAPQHSAGQQQATPYPDAQYPAAQYPAGQQQAYGQQHPPVSGSGNPVARTAFIVALAVAAVGAFQIVMQPFVLAWLSYTASSFGVFSSVFAVIIFLGSAAALVLGLIALRRSGGRVLAGVAIGVGGIQLIGVVLGWISSLFYSVF